MYLAIQNKINQFMIVLFVLNFGLLFALNHFFGDYKGVLVALFFVVFMIDFIVIRFLEKNWEHWKIYKMLQEGDIALAKVKQGKFYKNIRETDFVSKKIYSLELVITTKDFQQKEVTIFEYMYNDDFSALPGYVYVTYNEGKETIGVIPTVLLSMVPKIEPIVRKFEKKIKPTYIVVAKKNGLLFKKMEDVIKRG